MEANEPALARAVEQSELVVHYQPIVSVKGGGLEGYEALVRWDRPGFGQLQPMEFIPLAEKSDLICDLDTWVLNKAAHQLGVWNRTRTPQRPFVAVNISGRHLNAARVRDDVSAVLDTYDIEPGQLVLEVTETFHVEDGPALTHIRHLRRRGVRLSLDDFGTGYNSFDQLPRLPVDVVKIDRSYLDVGSLAAREQLALMVEACHALGLPVIGEGVDSPEQLALLNELDVESAQGFLLGRPLPAAELP